MIELLDRADSLDLVHEVRGAAERYSFRHALIREALYDGLPAAKRRRLHRVVAESIRGSQRGAASRYAEIAYHYCQGASPGDADAAIEYSRQAAHTAQKQLAYEEAASHLRNAIEALALKRAGDDPIQAELLCDLGEAQVKTGDVAEARKTCLSAADIARRVGRPDLFARAVLAPGRVLSLSGVTDQALVQLLHEARTMLGGADSPLLAQTLARLGIELYWSDRDQAVALCQQAAEMAVRLDDPLRHDRRALVPLAVAQKPGQPGAAACRHARNDPARRARRRAGLRARGPLLPRSPTSSKRATSSAPTSSTANT